MAQLEGMISEDEEDEQDMAVGAKRAPVSAKAPPSYSAPAHTATAAASLKVGATLPATLHHSSVNPPAAVVMPTSTLPAGQNNNEPPVTSVTNHMIYPGPAGQPMLPLQGMYSHATVNDGDVDLFAPRGPRECIPLSLSLSIAISDRCQKIWIMDRTLLHLRPRIAMVPLLGMALSLVIQLACLSLNLSLSKLHTQ
jgi:hypothetical protein